MRRHESVYKMERRQLQEEVVRLKHELKLKDEELAGLRAGHALLNKRYTDLLESKPVDKMIVLMEMIKP